MNRSLLAAVVLTAALTVAACDSSPSAGRADVTIRLTDAPFPFDLADSANVSIVRIEMAGSDSTENRVVLYDGDPIDVNLLDLRNGIDTTLTRLSIPLDDYRQIRFILADDARVVFNDGRAFDLRVPSGQQSGIKVNLPDLDLDDDGETVDVLVDFDVERSFVVRGGDPSSPNFQGFTFRPVLHVESLVVGGTPVPTDTTGNG